MLVNYKLEYKKLLIFIGRDILTAGGCKGKGIEIRIPGFKVALILIIIVIMMRYLVTLTISLSYYVYILSYSYKKSKR